MHIWLRRGLARSSAPPEQDGRLSVVIWDQAIDRNCPNTGLSYLAYPEAMAALVPWLVDGKIKYRLDVVDGLEDAATAVTRLYTGENKGKLVVAVAPRA